MIPLIDVNQRVEYVSEHDKTEPKTVFVIRPMSGADRTNIGLSDDKSPIYMRILKEALVEIKGIEMDKDSVLKQLPMDVLNELMSKINEVSGITENDKKN